MSSAHTPSQTCLSILHHIKFGASIALIERDEVTHLHVITHCVGVPKTRSGKIMRRILRKIASKQEKDIGDTSTLADPSVVDQLLETRGK